MVLAAATPRLAVVFGGFTLDSTNQIELQMRRRRYQLWETHQEGFFSVEFVLRLAAPTGNDATDDLAFKALINATEAALSKRRVKLTVTLGGNVINGNGAGWDPAKAATTPTAMGLEGRVLKLGGSDNARRRTYLFEVRCSLPAETSFGRRRDATTQTIQGVNGRRICSIRGHFTASANASALDNYTAAGGMDGFCTTQLPAPVSNGQWVQVTEDPVYDDADGNFVGGNEITATRIYWEVVYGLREFKVDVVQQSNQAKVVTISGLFMATPDGQTALQNYNAAAPGGWKGLDPGILDGEGGHANFESKFTPGTTSYDTVGKLYRFIHVYKQIVYPQGPGNVVDDANITDFSLEVSQNRTYTRQTQTSDVHVDRLQRATATYRGIIDVGSSGGLDPYALYTAKFRAYILTAVMTKLGSLSVIIETEQPTVSLDGNMLVVVMQLLIRAGSVLSLTMMEAIVRTPAIDPDPMLDGDAYGYWPYKNPPMKILLRRAVVEYLTGSQKPKIWGPGTIGSNFQFINTGKTMEEVLDALEDGTIPIAPGWCPKEPGALSESFAPGSWGENDQMQTVVLTRDETWFFVKSWGQQSLSKKS